MKNNIQCIRDQFGAIDLSKLPIKNFESRDSYHFVFDYNDSRYYLKRCLNIKNLYHELIAEELARDYGLKCPYTDIAFIDGDYYVISADMHTLGDKYISIDKLFNASDDSLNNLSDLWNKFTEVYGNEQIVRNLMKQLVDIFLFDILIANVDRHMCNYGLLENASGISLDYIFDNENMLDSISIYEGGYSIGIDRSDYFIFENEGMHFLEKFLTISDKAYYDYFKEKLNIISVDNLLKAFSRVETKIGCMVHPQIKADILKKFDENHQVIDRVIYRFNKCR